MTRRMSCSLTVEAVRDHTKTVTRRHVDTWKSLGDGDRLTLIEKGMGLPKGSRQVKLAEVMVTSVSVEAISWAATLNECELEGMPQLAPAEFVRFWLASHGYGANAAWTTKCRRIKFRYLDEDNL